MGIDAKVPEEYIAELRTIVYKTTVDESTLKLIGEKEKLKLFKKMPFLKRGPEDIQFESLEKFYEPFITASGKYHVDYYRRRTYQLEAEDDVSELVIFNHVLKPETSTLAKMQRKGQTVELEADERVVREQSAYLILDWKGREITVDELPAAPAEENPEGILAEAGENVWSLEVTPEKAVETVRARIVDRPRNAVRMSSETFEVTERTVVYVPLYEVTYKKLDSGETKSLVVNGVTSAIDRSLKTQREQAQTQRQNG
ncbi:MAG: hypothetical protein NWE76_06620 [Candidatus Bathyarchaeota archaeon]|nr:hypothetical protein [Candidatus Bathyarchaeota archaeon]